MPTLHDEGGASSRATGADGAPRILQDPYGVTFKTVVKGTLWHTAKVVAARVREGALVFDRYDIDKLYPTHVLGLGLLQGMALTRLFPKEGYLHVHQTIYPGPFLFVAGELVLSTPPPQLSRVTLVRVVDCPKEASPEELLGKMVAVVLTGR